MILSDIKYFIRCKKQTSVNIISETFEIEVSAIDAMIDQLAAKGYVERISNDIGCRDNDETGCSKKSGCFACPFFTMSNLSSPNENQTIVWCGSN